MEDPFKSTSLRELSKLARNVSLNTWLASLNTVLTFPIDSRSWVNVFSEKIIEIINVLTRMTEQTGTQILT